MTTNPNTPANEDADAVRTVAPALERYTETTLSEVWKRPDLSARDRSLVTVAALIARNQAAQLSPYLNRAFDNGVKAAELSEVITHLAFYSGWGRRGFTRVASEPISFLPPPARFCRWTRRPSRNERHRSNKTSAPFRRAWCNPPAIRCFMTRGGARRSRGWGARGRVAGCRGARGR